MEEKWLAHVEGTTQYRLAERCKLFKAHLKSFNFQEFSDLSKRAKEATETLERLQLREDIDTKNMVLRDQIMCQKKIAAYLIESERAYFEQIAKLKFLLLGDQGTSLFHSLVKRNNAQTTFPSYVGMMVRLQEINEAISERPTTR